MGHSTRVLCRKWSPSMCWYLASTLGSFLQWFTPQEFRAGGRVLVCADVWHLHMEVFCKSLLCKNFVQEGEFWRVLMPGIYMVKVFAMIHSTRVLCRSESSGLRWCLASTWWRFLQGFIVEKSCVQEGEFWRVLMPGIFVAKFFCNFSLNKTFVQEGEFWRVLMPGIYVVKFFARIPSTRVCAGGRVLACANAWNLCDEVFCNGSLFKSCVH